MAISSREKDAKRKRNEAYADHIASKRKPKKKRSAKASRQSARDQQLNEFAKGTQ